MLINLIGLTGYFEVGMKKKLLLAILAVVTVIASIVALVACNPNDTNNTDKSFQNQEFVGFRKKIVTILKDNGIFVNDIDAKQKAASSSSNAKLKFASAATLSDNAFDELLAKPEYLGNYDDYEFALRQVFGTSLRMSLCLGDGISNYFGETSFFDIAVKIGESYMCVTEDGNVNTVRAYSPGETSDGDIFDNIDVEYVSATNYTFTSLSLGNGSTMFASGNAQKQFIMIVLFTGGDGGEVIYSPNGSTFYTTDKYDVVEACCDIVGDNAFELDRDEFYANRTNAKYTFTQEQNQALTDKYFKDIQSSSSDGRVQGVLTVTKGGITYADEYWEKESHDTVTIPSDIQYINKDFVVRDLSGTVTKLYIPKSVKGIIKTHDDKTGEELATPKVVDVSEFIPQIDVVNSGQANTKVFKSIIVENGSTLFKSGTGHLRAADGRYLYLIDAPLEDYDMSLFSEFAAYTMERYEEFGYTNLYFTATEVDINFDEDAVVDFNSPLFRRLDTINISGTAKDGESHKLGMTLEVSDDLTVNVEFENAWRQSLDIAYFFRSKDARSHNVTLNVKGLTSVSRIDADGVQVTVNVEIPEMLFETSGIAKPNPDGNSEDTVTVIFTQPAITEEQRANFTFEINTLSGEVGVTAIPTDKRYESPIHVTLPKEFADFSVNALTLPMLNNLEIELTDNIKYLVRGAMDPPESIATLVYNGTQAQFDEQVRIICEKDDYAFYLQPSDGDRVLYQGKNAISFKHLTIHGLDGNEIVKDIRDDEPVFVEIAELGMYDPECAYFLIDSEGNGMQVRSTDGDWIQLYPTQDNPEYTLTRMTIGKAESDYYPAIEYKVQYRGAELTVAIYFFLAPALEFNMNVYGQVEDGNIVTRYYVDSRDMFTANMTINVQDVEMGMMNEPIYQQIKFNWIWDDDHVMTLDSISDVSYDDKKEK